MIAERPSSSDVPSDPTRPADWDQKEMSFTEHLRELRNRLMISIVTVGVLAVGLFAPSPAIISWLKNLYFPGVELNAFSPTDVIFIEFKFSLYGAIVLALPVLLYQIWMFVVPAVHPKTRRVVYAYIVPSFLLALGGIAFCHFFILPRVIGALLAMTGAVAKATFGIEATLNLILVMLLAFALVFQTPVIMVGLARIGIVNVAMLRKYRRYALMGILVVSGLAAPDASPTTMLMLAVPMYLLYELSILVIVLLQPRWRSA